MLVGGRGARRAADGDGRVEVAHTPDLAVRVWHQQCLPCALGVHSVECARHAPSLARVIMTFLCHGVRVASARFAAHCPVRSVNSAPPHRRCTTGDRAGRARVCTHVHSRSCGCVCAAVRARVRCNVILLRTSGVAISDAGTRRGARPGTLRARRARARRAARAPRGPHGTSTSMAASAGALAEAVGVAQPREVAWSHGTNSARELRDALAEASGVHYVETDLMCSVDPQLSPAAAAPGQGAHAICCHPPERATDLPASCLVEEVAVAAGRGRRIGLKLGACMMAASELARVATSESAPLALTPRPSPRARPFQT